MKYRRRSFLQELTIAELEVVSGGQFGCSLPSLSGAAAGFGVGLGLGVTAGAATGKSAMAAAGGYIGTALVGSALIGYSIGVAINRALGQCKPAGG